MRGDNLHAIKRKGGKFLKEEKYSPWNMRIASQIELLKKLRSGDKKAENEIIKRLRFIEGEDEKYELEEKGVIREEPEKSDKAE